VVVNQLCLPIYILYLRRWISDNHIKLYQHSTQCSVALQIFLKCHPRYWCFVPMTGLRKLVENKLVDTLKNKYRPHPHSAICMSESHLCIVKLVGEEKNYVFVENATKSTCRLICFRPIFALPTYTNISIKI